MLIALPSFGESLRRAPPKPIPAEACHLKKYPARWRAFPLSSYCPLFVGNNCLKYSCSFSLYDSTTGKTTVNVLPTSTVESTQIRPL